MMAAIVFLLQIMMPINTRGVSAVDLKAHHLFVTHLINPEILVDRAKAKWTIVVESREDAAILCSYAAEKMQCVEY